MLHNGTTTTTKYYNAGGQRVAMRTGSTLYYLLNDDLGGTSLVLTSGGGVQAVQLYAPYGAVRYNQGTVPTTYNYTGQRLDSETGLLYYGFRYYDPVVGQFVRADNVETNAGGMDGYGYVGENPETLNDPTGQYYVDFNGNRDNGNSGSSGSSGGSGGNWPPLSLPNYYPSATVVPVAPRPHLPGRSDGASNGLTSCGVVYTQATCGNFGVWFALYLEMGGQIGLPGNFCLDCGSFGGGSGGGDTYGPSSDLTSYLEEEGLIGGGETPTDSTAEAEVNSGPDVTPIDLYRSGRGGDPALDNVRPGKEFTPGEDGSQILYPDQNPPNGLSTYEAPTGPGKWWKLPAGSSVPEGLRFTNDLPGHWTIEPVNPMSIEDYKALVMKLRDWEGPIRIK